MAFGAIKSNKLRTFLTMLGILIGVTALIVLVSIGNGATGSVTDEISSMGTDYMSVRISDDKENPVRIKEFLSMFDGAESVGETAPIAMSSGTAETSYSSGTAELYGTTGGYFGIMGDEIAYGRNLKVTDIENHNYVCVISYDTAVELFGHADAVGETFTIDGLSFEVVGILSEDSTTPGSQMNMMASENSSDDSDSEDSTVTLECFIPYSTMSRMADNVLDIDQFYVSAADSDDMDAAEAEVTSVLLDRFGNDEDAFSITTQSEIQEAMTNVRNTLAIMLGGIAAISLLVGGIGIMNIMLVSVTERTREIGIRKAIGASRGSIMAQFLIEALIVSLSGCAAGIGLSAVIIAVANRAQTSMTLSLDPKVALIAVAFSAFIGIVFGIYPARKAAAEKPIDALRFEG